MRQPKIIIVGGGLAGLMATIRVAEAGVPVELFSIVPVKRSHSVCAQGGIWAIFQPTTHALRPQRTFNAEPAVYSSPETAASAAPLRLKIARLIHESHRRCAVGIELSDAQRCQVKMQSVQDAGSGIQRQPQ